MTELYYFVHSSTIDNEKGIASGQKDIPLSERGIQEANNLKNLIDTDIFDVVFCSDLVRAKQTAEIVFKGKDIICDSRLRECDYGMLNGKDKKLVSYSEHITNPFPCGESLSDVLSRVSDFLDFIKKNYNGKRVAVVSHRAPQLAFLVKIYGITFEQAIKEDWRKTGAWQPGWKYTIWERI